MVTIILTEGEAMALIVASELLMDKLTNALKIVDNKPEANDMVESLDSATNRIYSAVAMDRFNRGLGEVTNDGAES
jgi:hypothetical protein